MLLIALWLFLFSKASDSDDALVVGVENTLDECSSIVEAVGDFLDVVEVKDDLRRRAEEKDGNLATDVKKKLEICAANLEAVDAFRSHHLLLDLSFGLSERNFLNKLLKPVSKKMGGTLYAASKDGDSASAFHSACDNEGPTVVIVQTTSGAVFGGYTDVSWTSSSTYVSSTTSFLFQLRPYMKQYALKKGKEGYAVYHNSGYGPTFGNSHDLNIRSYCLGNTNSYTNGGSAYTFSKYPSYELNDGEKNFKVKDYVVVKAIAL